MIIISHYVNVVQNAINRIEPDMYQLIGLMYKGMFPLFESLHLSILERCSNINKPTWTLLEYHKLHRWYFFQETLQL